MGLFDHVEIHDSIELPEFEGDREEVDWQTKSIERPTMRTYRVTDDGRLLEEEYHTESVPEEERPAYNEEIGGFESGLDEIYGSINWITDGWTEKNYHGRMRVVGSTEDYFYQYYFKFTDSVLEEVELDDKREK